MKKIICFLIISALLTLSITGCSGKSEDSNKTSDIKYDENNVGEIYAAEIDPEHIAIGESEIKYIDNEVLLVAKNEVSKNEIEALAKDINAEIVGYIEQTGDYQLNFSQAMTEKEVGDLIADLNGNSLIESASFNYVFDIDTASVEYNINYGEKWKDSPTLIISQDSILDLSCNEWGVKAINAPFAWFKMDRIKYFINPINVGLIDIGFDETHEDLAFKQVFYENGANSVNITDEKHGTHVAGTMAARGDNNKGICGVYPYSNGRLYAASWSGADEYELNQCSSSFKDIVCLAELVLRNVKVINASYGFTYYAMWYNDESEINSKTELAKHEGNFLKRLLEKGYDFVLVVSAGNNSDDYVTTLSYNYNIEEYNFKTENGENTIEYDPNGKKTIIQKYSDTGRYFYRFENTNDETYTDYIIQNATDDVVFNANEDIEGGHLDSRYNSLFAAVPNDEEYKDVYNRIIVVGSIGKSLDISNFSNAGERTEIYAPGENIYIYIYSTIPGNGYSNDWSGTSMAAPHVAGVAANVLSINNGLTGAQVKEIVCSSTLKNSKDGIPVVDCTIAVQKAIDKNINLHKYNFQIGGILDGGIFGWVFDGDDRATPIENVSVVPYSNGTALTEYSVSTDKYGHFELIIPSGDYELHFTKGEDYDEKILSAIVSNGEVNYLNEGIDEVIGLFKSSTSNTYSWIMEPTYEYNDVQMLECFFGQPYGRASLARVVDSYTYMPTEELQGLFVAETDSSRTLINLSGKVLFSGDYSQIRAMTLSGGDSFFIYVNSNSDSGAYWIDENYKLVKDNGLGLGGMFDYNYYYNIEDSSIWSRFYSSP